VKAAYLQYQQQQQQQNEWRELAVSTTKWPTFHCGGSAATSETTYNDKQQQQLIIDEQLARQCPRAANFSVLECCRLTMADDLVGSICKANGRGTIVE
jgi:hypothetical protein